MREARVGRSKTRSREPVKRATGPVAIPAGPHPVPGDSRMLAVLDQFPALIWRSGRDAKCNYFNYSWLEFTGRTLEQELGDGWSEGVHPEDRERCVREYLDAFGARKPFALEYRLRYRDGTYRRIRDVGKPLFDPGEEFTGYIGGCFDLSEHARTIESLRQSEERFSRIFHSSPAAMTIGTIDEHRLIDVNQRFLELFGYRRDEVIGRTSPELDLTVDIAQRNELIRRGMAGESVRDIELQFRRKSGETGFVQFSGEVLRLQNESVWVTMRVDITELKRSEELLKLQSAAAIAVSEATNFRSGLEAVIRLACEMTGWQIGEAWLPEASGERLIWSGAFYSSVAGIDRFIAQSERRTYGRGERFIGKVWESRQPAWRDGPLGGALRSDLVPGGMHAHCAIPVTADGEVVAVMSFFSQRQRAHDRPLLDSIATIAMKLAMLVKHKRAEDALRHSERQLRHALHARERLMQDLHDNTVQSIYAVGMNLVECQHLINENPAKAAALLQNAVGSLNDVISGVRGHISGRGLRSPGGAQFRAELLRLAKECGETGPVRFRVKVDPAAAAQVTAREAEQLLSIAREAISNAMRHSRARQGALSLRRVRDGVCLDVSDDGAGFKTRMPRNAGSGLYNMEHRAREIKARIKFVSAPGRGTRIVLTLPGRQAGHGAS